MEALQFAQDEAKYRPSPWRLPAPQPRPRVASPDIPGTPWECSARQWAIACVCLPRTRTFSGLRQEPVLLTGQAKGRDVKVPGSSDPHPTGTGEMPQLPLGSVGQQCRVFCLVAQWSPRGTGPLIRVPVPCPLCMWGPPPKPTAHTQILVLVSVVNKPDSGISESPAYTPGQLCPFTWEINKGVLCPCN